MAISAARGFVFDLDGTLVQRSATGVTPVAGATEVLEAVRTSGRPLVVFTNASHVGPGTLAAGVRASGLQLGDDEVLTPICSALSYLARRHVGARVLLLGTAQVAERMTAAGVELVAEAEAASAEVVLVAHVDRVDLALLESAARAVIAGASLLTASYARAYAGADGPILSRGAMTTAAIAKASGRRPAIVGKPSRAAIREAALRLGVPSAEIAVVGDDVGMDIALGHLGGSHTVLVRSGITGSDLHRVSARRRPDLVVDGVADLLPLL
jgi:HAD superfamily hydrolase (TIGR01450 family)